jgi:truncated hemoglobin YjbI
MAAAHPRLNITKGAFDAVIRHLLATLTKIDLPDEMLGEVRAKLLPLETRSFKSE